MRAKPIGPATGRVHWNIPARPAMNSSSRGRLPSTSLRLLWTRASPWRSASATSTSLGALEQIVVYSFSSLTRFTRLGSRQASQPILSPGRPWALDTVPNEMPRS